MPPLHPLSPAEINYLHTSLSLSPPIRPDCRSPTQFRPLTAELEILPSTYGSSRLVWPNGGECIVGVKAEVEAASPTNKSNWVEVSVEIGGGARDDDPLAVFLASGVAETLSGGKKKLGGRLGIGKNWHWRLFIDILLLTPPISHPATLLSFATHLALRDTRIPRLISEAEEDPMFDNDWDAAGLLYPDDAADAGDVPAITLLVAAVGENVFFDPTREEMCVADCCLAVSVDYDGLIVSVRMLESGGVGEGGGVKRDVLRRVVKESRTVAKEVYASLAAIVKSERD